MSSIRRQLTWSLLAGLLLLILLYGLVFFLLLRRALVQEFDAAQSTGAAALMSLAEQEADGSFEFDLPPELAPRFEPSNDSEYFQIWHEGGATLARSQSLDGADLIRRTGVGDEPAIWDLTLPDGRSGRALGVEFTPPVGTDEDEAAPPPGFRPAGAVLIYARSREPLDRLLRLAALALLGLGLLLPVCGVLIIRSAVGRGLAPLHQISEEIGAVDPDRLSHRFSRQGAPSELEPIVDRLNGLLRRLEEAFERERRFSSNVAHELRTPISELRALAEMALRSEAVRKLDNPTRSSFEDVLAIALQMERIVTALLALGRAERGEEARRLEKIDLVSLLARTWAPCSKAAEERDLSIEFDLPQRAEVRTDAVLLSTVLSNVFGNAVIHAPRGGSIYCRLNLGTDSQILTVGNSNESLRREDLARIFEPLWQKDPSRSDPNHSGLGLATVASVGSLLGIEIRADLLENGFFELRIEVPNSIA